MMSGMLTYKVGGHPRVGYRFRFEAPTVCLRSKSMNSWFT